MRRQHRHHAAPPGTGQSAGKDLDTGIVKRSRWSVPAQVPCISPKQDGCIVWPTGWGGHARGRSIVPLRLQESSSRHCHDLHAGACAGQHCLHRTMPAQSKMPCTGPHSCYNLITGAWALQLCAAARAGSLYKGSMSDGGYTSKLQV